jgi:hypothetical protein
MVGLSMNRRQFIAAAAVIAAKPDILVPALAPAPVRFVEVWKPVAAGSLTYEMVAQFYEVVRGQPIQPHQLIGHPEQAAFLSVMLSTMRIEGRDFQLIRAETV